MLTRLSIRNVILIESCDLALAPGLCVLSGETGAGKSILLDAVGLVLGARAENGLVRRGEESGSVTAEFDISRNIGAREVLKSLELEDSDTLIIRRVIQADGKTRCIVNDQAITVAGLKKLGDTLLEVHGQHDQRGLQDMTLHRATLDDYAGLIEQRKQVSDAYRAWRGCRDAVAALKSEIEKAAREQDYLRHMYNELKQLSPLIGEEDTLAHQRTTMMQSEKLYALLNDAVGELQAGKGVIAGLRNAQRTLTRSPLTTSEAFQPVVEGLERAAIEAEEALYILEKIRQQATYNPDTLEQIEERLFALRAAGRKYNLPVDGLAQLYQEVEDKLALMDSQDHRMAGLEKKEQETQAIFLQAAEGLSQLRQKAGVKLEKAIEKELVPLKMGNTRFRVYIERLEQSYWSEWGVDAVRFECATNVSKGDKDVEYSPLSKIASGGELSRFMLAMKVALSSIRSTPTMIFDEIDTGTGGAVAAAIGERLSVLGQTTQVLVVTHLPQVAARGTQHLRVAKLEKGKKIVTQVEDLSPEEREEELARMLAGASITAEARKAAQKLLEPVA